jgi:hypothetical protein
LIFNSYFSASVEDAALHNAAPQLRPKAVAKRRL